MFEFADITRINGDEVDLVLSETREAVPEKEHLPCYVFDICPHGTDIKAGIISYRVGYNRNIHYGGNIGYGVFKGYQGNYFAAKACLLLKDLAIRHGQESLVITCDPDNIGSRKTCERLGAELIEIINLPEWTEMYKMGKKVKCRYKWKLV
jgi:tagatose 1,6-diphosphate aldolase